MYIAAQGNTLHVHSTHILKLLPKFTLISKALLRSISGPTDNSVEDFWRMIWEERIPTVVMLTKIYEGKVHRTAKL